MIQSKPNLITLCFLMSLPLVGAILFTPSIAELLESFETSPDLSHLTIAVYLGGYAIGQLPYGWITNRYGKKRSIYLGCGVFMLGSLACAIAPTFKILIVCRGLMALGAAVGVMMTFTLVSAFFPIKEARKVLSYLGLSLAFAPGLASFLGGILVQVGGWKACFYALAAYAAIVMFMGSRLPEDDRKEQQEKLAISTYIDTLKQVPFVLLMVVGALTTVIVYIFAFIAPMVTVCLLEMAPHIYGLVSFIPVLGNVGGSLLAAWLTNYLSARQVISLGLGICFSGALLKWGLVQMFDVQIWSFFIPMALVYFGMSLIYANCIAICMSMSSHKSIGSALFCSANIGLSLLGVLIVGWIGPISMTSVPLVFLAIASIMVLLFGINMWVEKAQLFASQSADEL